MIKLKVLRVLFCAMMLFSTASCARAGTGTTLITGTPTTITSPTPSPTATPAAAPTAAGQPQILTVKQQERLYQAAVKFVSQNETQALQTAHSLGYLDGNGAPETMCGPLSIAILRDAGLIDFNIDLDKFFYLDPRPGKNDATMANDFPDQIYEKIEVQEPSYSVDFSKQPLKAGDFVYLFAGSRGNFDHIITVDRVDAEGRAYAVTNLNTPDGYVIREVMLYDPLDPGVGQIYDWTNKENWQLGLTGFGGMWIWRLRQAQIDPDAKTADFVNAIQSKMTENGGEWHVYIRELGKDPLYTARAYEPIHPASTIKIADAILFFKALEQKGVNDIPAYLTQYGSDSRSFEQLLRAMLVNSEEEATTALENWTAGVIDPNQTLHDMGFTRTFITPRQSSAEEISRMLELLYEGKLLDQECTGIILKYLGDYSENDNTLIGVIRKNLGPDDLLYDKRGEIASPRIVVADAALLKMGDRVFVIAIYAYHDPKNGASTYENLQSGLEAISMLFWDYINET